MKKKIILGFALLASVSVLTACGDKSEEDVLDEGKKVPPIEIEFTVNDLLLSHFAYPETELTPYYLNSEAKYTHELVNRTEEQKDGNTIISSDVRIGKLNEEGTFVKESDNLYKLTQTITDNQIVENVEVDKEGNQAFSSIPNKIILQKPLEKGNNWTQEVDLNGEKVQIKTEITESYYDEEYKEWIVVTESVITNGELKDKLLEKATYHRGAGLIFMERNSLSEDDEAYRTSRVR